MVVLKCVSVGEQGVECHTLPTLHTQLLEDIDEHNTSKLKLADFKTLLSR